jgi:NAD(P)-dependent dehydrogenase (short-subunit alcohol dehydrogenase family)
MTRHLAGHHGGKGITFNSIAPGPFQSKSMSIFALQCVVQIFSDELFTVMKATLEAFGDAIVSRVPMGRIGSPEDVAGTCIFLSSRAGAYVNGATITLDGGSITSPPHL